MASTATRKYRNMKARLRPHGGVANPRDSYILSLRFAPCPVRESIAFHLFPTSGFAVLGPQVLAPIVPGRQRALLRHSPWPLARAWRCRATSLGLFACGAYTRPGRRAPGPVAIPALAAHMGRGAAVTVVARQGTAACWRKHSQTGFWRARWQRSLAAQGASTTAMRTRSWRQAPGAPPAPLRVSPSWMATTRQSRAVEVRAWGGGGTKGHYTRCGPRPWSRQALLKISDALQPNTGAAWGWLY